MPATAPEETPVKEVKEDPVSVVTFVKVKVTVFCPIPLPLRLPNTIAVDAANGVSEPKLEAEAVRAKLVSVCGTFQNVVGSWFMVGAEAIAGRLCIR